VLVVYTKRRSIHRYLIIAHPAGSMCSSKHTVTHQ
jgi:hypothetical protein